MFKIASLSLAMTLFCSSFVQAANQVCFKDQCITVELAQTEEERMRGLQFRETLAADKGMLFLFPDSSKYGFWMKDTKIPLDIIWLDKERRIVEMIEDVPPCFQDPCESYVPHHPALYVLEVAAGTVVRQHLQEGDELTINLEAKEAK